jgi:hypothetical protein
MKHSDSTEIDRLLHRYARRGGEALPAARSVKSDATAAANTGAHLDADEMNAYAEGALPEAARSRYFTHLADCNDCRKLVTELTLAASRADEGKARIASLEPSPSKSWRERLAAIFSPPVLRYGVPALALFAVIVVAIVAIRTNRRESGVALNVDQSKYSAPAGAPDANPSAETTTTGTTENHSNSNVAPFEDQQSRTPPRVDAAPSPTNPTLGDDAAPVLSKERIPKSQTAQTNDTKNTSGEAEAAGRRDQQEVVAVPPPTSQPAPKTTMAEAAPSEAADKDNRDEQKKSKAAAREDNNETVVVGRSSGGIVDNQRVANDARPEAGKATAARAAQSESRKRSSNAAKSVPQTSDMVSEKEESAETRSVGGRRFRRQGSSWVDTAYNSSRPTTNVARGSEQYRALVADEPALRTITQQLGGEVIVVWKSRAYRFF